MHLTNVANLAPVTRGASIYLHGGLVKGNWCGALCALLLGEAVKWSENKVIVQQAAGTDVMFFFTPKKQMTRLL